ncbi:MAG: M1 family aminopeptidase [Ginsengibacter sp.]
MKRILFFVISFISTSYAQQSGDYLKSIDNIASAESNAYARVSASKNATSASQNFDIKYYRCEWQVDPAVRYITGKVTSYFIITSPADNISFDLMDALIVDSVKQNNNIISFEHLNNSLKINFASSEPAGILDSVSIWYQGVPPNTGFGSFVTSIHAGVPGMWTLSEPYGSRDWWPCKNGLDDKTDSIDVIITTPSQYTAASNGLRKNIDIDGANKITHWKHRYPIATYLICMAVTNYSEFENTVQVGSVNLPMQTFCYPESLAPFQANTPLVLAALQYYSSVFGSYPFIKEKYGQVQFGWGGGQEHQTSTFIISPDEGLMAHELGHQWFGDKITCGSWQDIWLNEGFATHLASMDFEKKYPLTVIATRKSEIANITALPGGSVSVDDTTNVSRIFDSRLTYRKGSHLLYMLRWKLGDSIFFKGIRRYFNDSTLSFGFAKTGDLERNLEAVSGIDLKEFFDDWFYGQGYPSYKVQWTQIGNDYVKINISQTTSHSSVGFFALPVALQFKNATQQKTVIVDNKFNGQIFFNDIGFIADTIIIDPDYWLITKNNTSQKVKDSINGENIVQIFPNPFTNSFNVYLRNFTQQNGALKIFNTQGQLLFRKNIMASGSFFTEVNTQSFPPGMYVLKIEAGNEVKFTKKILKQ